MPDQISFVFEGGETWVEKAGKGVHPVNNRIVAYLRQMLDAESNVQPHTKRPSERMPMGGKLSVNSEFVSIFSSGPPAFLDVFADTMKVILGDPTSDERIEHKGELESRSIQFEGGISANYMLSRGDGITINIPRDAVGILRKKIDELGLLKNQGFGSPA